MSRPPRGGRGLKSMMSESSFAPCWRRPPRGGRGLKSLSVISISCSPPSPSSRRAWIEISYVIVTKITLSRRPPRGGRGLKCFHLRRFRDCIPSPSSRRAWIEMRLYTGCSPSAARSPSSRRAWIEIPPVTGFTPFMIGRPPRGGRGLKLKKKFKKSLTKWSPSSRRAWIEISCKGLVC